MSDRIESRLKEERRFHPSAAFADRARVRSHARLRGAVPAVARGAGGVLARADGGPGRGARPGRRSRSGRCPQGEVLRRREAQRERELPRPAPRDGARATRPRSSGRASRATRARSRTSSCTARWCGSPAALARPRRRRRAIASPSTWAWSPRPSSRCSRARASARRTRSSSAASAPRRCAIASTTAAPRCSSRRTARGAAATSCRSRRWPTRPSSRRRRIEKVVVLRRIGRDRGAACTMKEGRDVWWDDWLGRRAERGEPRARDARPTRSTPSTRSSSSTRRARPGKPKGVLHTTAGYLAGAHVTTQVRLRPARRGHLLVHGRRRLGHGPQLHRVRAALVRRDVPACTRARPNFPDWGRFWRIIERHGVTILYTAPTAIRAFIRAGDEWPSKHDLSSLRLLGQRGRADQPGGVDLVPPRHRRRRCPIVDTWWQTETGAIMLTTLPGAVVRQAREHGPAVFRRRHRRRRRTAASPAAPNEGGKLVIRRPWPSMARTLWGDDERYLQDLLGRDPGRVLHGRRRAARRGRLLLGRRPHRRRAQRRRSPHRHGRDRERAREPPGGRRGRRGRPPGRAQGPGARRLRHA